MFDWNGEQATAIIAPMGLDSLAWAFRQELDEPLQKLVLLALANAEPRDYPATYQLEELAADCCSSSSEVLDALDRLECEDKLTWGVRDLADGNIEATFHMTSAQQRRGSDSPLDAIIYIFDGGREMLGGVEAAKLGISRDVDRRLEFSRQDSHDGITAFARWRAPMPKARHIESQVLTETPARMHHFGSGWVAMSPKDLMKLVTEQMRMTGLPTIVEAS